MSFVKNIQKYSKGVTMPGGYAHFLPDTLRKIDRYWEGKFLGGDVDSTKKHKFFAQMSRPLSEDASKNVDINTSMIRLLSQQSGKELSMWVMSRELQQWLEEQAFDSLINDVTDDLPRYGHIILKKYAGGVGKCEIHNIRTDPSAPWLNASDFVYELHRLFRWEIEGQNDWDGNAIEQLFRANKKQDYDIYECYDLDNDHYKHSFKAWYKKPSVASGGGTSSTEAYINQPNNLNEPPLDLFSEEVEIDDFPYREHKWSNVKGRWLGGGAMEYLFDDQLHTNEVSNLRMRALYLKALKILQSTDDNVGGNVLRDMNNGQIIKSAGQLRWLQADESDLSAFGTEDSRWDQLSTKKMFAFDSMNMPARMNQKVLQRIFAQQTNYYKKKRENLGIFFKNLIYHDIIPDFKNKSQKEHQMNFVASYADMDQFVKFITEAQVDKASYEYMAKTGFMPSDEEKLREAQKIEKAIRKRETQSLKIPKGFYEHLTYKIKIVITGENKDLENESQILTQFFQLLAQNPAVLQNKVTRTIAFKLLEMQGVQPGDLDMIDSAINSQPQGQGAPQPGGGAPGAPGQGAPAQQLPTGSPMAKPTANAGAAPMASRQGI